MNMSDLRKAVDLDEPDSPIPIADLKASLPAFPTSALIGLIARIIADPADCRDMLIEGVAGLEEALLAICDEVDRRVPVPA